VELLGLGFEVALRVLQAVGIRAIAATTANRAQRRYVAAGMAASFDQRNVLGLGTSLGASIEDVTLLMSQ
jgi:hypothetical protein